MTPPDAPFPASEVALRTRPPSVPDVTDPALARLTRRCHRTWTAWVQLPETTPRGRHGGGRTVRQLAVDMEAVRNRIDRDPDDRRHRRVSRFSRVLVRALPVLDGLILFWFLANVLNADLGALDVLTLVSAGLAVLASLALAEWSRLTGEHLQEFRDRSGALQWGALDTTARLMLAVSLVVWLLVAAMMVVRVRDEVFQATGVLDGAGLLVAIVLGAALVVLNATVLYLAFADGSADTRELDRLARVVVPQRRRHERLARRLAAQTERLRTRAAARAAVGPPREREARTPPG
ncbi:hypothetical protein [Actinomycetospora flava]|uniref:Uncharacterized protein n=1 Tax=Actinomycetospora flava TaxID=3129232 RepID=A0ABU8M517_9PSEU